MSCNTFNLESGQKQETPFGSTFPPGIKVETSAREQQKPEQYKMETVANQQGQAQFKVETSAKQQGPPGVASAMQIKQRMTEAPTEDEEQAVQEENNDEVEDVANANQLVLGHNWPYGRYAMPMPITGCPPGWSTGSRYQDLKDIGFGAIGSIGIETRMRVEIGPNLRMYYCVKNSFGSFSSGLWPRGRYCIARKGGSCPTGFSTGSVYWDDEDTSSTSSSSGILPDGFYGFDTKIYFCCRSDGSTSTPIFLPTNRPFILYRFGPTCQRVAGMSIHQDYIYTDHDDTNYINPCTGSHPALPCGQVIRINFCYYYRHY